MKAAKHSTNAGVNANEVLNILAEYRWRWIIPAVLVSLGVALFALLKDDTWEVSQSIIVRNHAVSDDFEPGKFRSADPMRRAVDTIVEVCLSGHVLGAALTAVGPPPDENVDADTWPDDEAIQSLRETLSIEAPNGAEFGTTEVFFIKVTDSSRARAIALLEAVFQNLNERTQELHDERAREMLSEVEKMVALADADLQETTKKIKEIELSVGQDVACLRKLHASPGGNGEQEESFVAVDQQIMQLESQSAVNQLLLELLEAAREDPQLLRSAPPDLLATQPALGELREGLVAAALRTAALRGTFNDEAPFLKAAIREEANVRECILNELSCTIRLIKADMNLKSSRQQVLEGKRDKILARIQKLAAIRAEYTNLVNMVAHRQTALELAEGRLSEVRVQQAVARTSNSISRLDSPESGYRPIGPSRVMIALIGIAGGLFAGFGCVALTVVGQPSASDVNVNGSAPARTGMYERILPVGALNSSLIEEREPVACPQ